MYIDKIYLVNVYWAMRIFWKCTNVTSNETMLVIKTRMSSSSIFFIQCTRKYFSIQLFTLTIEVSTSWMYKWSETEFSFSSQVVLSHLAHLANRAQMTVLCLPSDQKFPKRTERTQNKCQDVFELFTNRQYWHQGLCCVKTKKKKNKNAFK